MIIIRKSLVVGIRELRVFLFQDFYLKKKKKNLKGSGTSCLRYSGSKSEVQARIGDQSLLKKQSKLPDPLFPTL